MRVTTRLLTTRPLGLIVALSVVLWSCGPSSGQGLIVNTGGQVGGGGGGGQTINDDFNRADSADAGANWTPVTGQLQIVSNSARLFDGSSACERYSGVTWTDNQSSEVKVTANATAAAGSGYGVAVRCSASANTFYRLVINGDGEWELIKKVTGSNTVLTSGTATYSAGAVLKLSAIGTTITSTYNGSQLDSRTDSAIASGSPGLAYSTSLTSGNMDDWTGIDGL